LAARGPGFKVYTEIIPFVTGVDVVEAQLRLLFSEEVILYLLDPLKGACLQFLSSDKNGKVKEISGIDKVKDSTKLYDFDVYVKPGDEVKALTCGRDRIGHIISFAESRAEACECVEEVLDTIKIEIEE
jgi:biotin carboxylase